MKKQTKIEWCHYTANLWWGCSHVHAGCYNCYAEQLAHRWHSDQKLWQGNRRMIKSTFANLAKWDAHAKRDGVRRLVFVGSMMDIFEKSQPLLNPTRQYKTTGDLRENFLHLLACGMYNNLIFLLLTKRPSNIPKMLPIMWHHMKPQNVMFGASASDQKTYDNMVRHLSLVDGKRFMSIEPQIDQIALNSGYYLDWVIQGGESGPHKRPFDIQWALDIRQDCHYYGVPYFFKQIDKVQPIPPHAMVRQFPDFENLEIPSK